MLKVDVGYILVDDENRPIHKTKHLVYRQIECLNSLHKETLPPNPQPTHTHSRKKNKFRFKTPNLSLNVYIKAVVKTLRNVKGLCYEIVFICLT